MTPHRRTILKAAAALGVLHFTGPLQFAHAAATKIKPDDSSALIVVDVQNCFVTGGTLPVKGGEEVVPVITAMVAAYTRGRGFDLGVPSDDLAAVITTASARMVANPEQLPTRVGSVEIRAGFQGFSLAETFVLNRYRKRAL